MRKVHRMSTIYNSRNYKGLVALSVCKDKQYNLDINDFLY